MTRRSFIVLPVVAAARADDASEIWAMFAKMAGSLSADNAEGFLEAVDPSMPGFEQLGVYLRGMIDQAEVRSIIDTVGDERGERERTVQLDWFLQMKRRGAGDRTENRRQVVTFAVRRQGKRWRIVKITPIEFFRPPIFAGSAELHSRRSPDSPAGPGGG